jgi:Tfp pilus assembly protein PilO
MAKKIPYFVNSNKILVLCSYVPQKIRLVITFAMLTIFIVIWQIFFYAPLNEKTCQYQEELKNNELQQQRLLRSLKKGDVVVKENQELKNFLSGATIMGSSEKEVGCDVIDAVVTIANSSNVACSSVVPLREAKPGEKSCEIGLMGTFYDIVAFLRQLQSVPAAVNVTKLECVRMHNQQISAHLAVSFARQ